MKRFNVIIIAVVLVYVSLAAIFLIVSRQEDTKESMEYKVEIHDIMRQLEQGAEVAALDVSVYQFVQEVTFLDKENEGNIATFYVNKNGAHTSIKPLLIDDAVKGYVRFDYVLGTRSNSMIRLVEGILLVIFVFVLALLIYIRMHILKPFHEISELPYELSKGHLKTDLKESKNRFFGRFIWGLGMLKDTLRDSKAKELKLLKEKKLLLLSISHDIKIPLSAIKLYAKALKENIYDSAEKRNEAAIQIETHAKEIEAFVKEIISASSEEIITIEVNNADFYLSDFAEKIREIYQPKAQVSLMELEIGTYENKLLKGDIDRAFEVMENLLENAFKYGDGKRITIDFYEEDYCQVVRVFNTGATVPLMEMPHLFDSFYRGSNAGDKQGNGLGLYICRQIMNKMDGEIFAERKEDGMSFGVVFRT